MIGRFLEQQQAICAVFMANRSLWHLNPSDGDYNVIENIHSVLAPLSKLTDMLSGETYVSVSAIFPVLQHVYDLMAENEMDAPKVKLMKAVILKDLKSRYEQEEQMKLVMKACFLDPRFKAVPFSDIEMTTQIQTELIAESVTLAQSRLDNADDETPPPPKKQNTTDGLSDLLREMSQKYKASSLNVERHDSKEVMAEREVTRYLQVANVDPDGNPLSWWQQFASVYPMLAPLARRYLAIPATSVPSERLFSGCGQIVTPHRNRLSQESVNKMIFLAKNLK